MSDAISTPQGTAIIRVVEKQTVTEDAFATGMDQMRGELINQRRDRFFSGFMLEAKKNVKIVIDQEMLQRVVGPAPAGGPATPAPGGSPVFPGR